MESRHTPGIELSVENPNPSPPTPPPHGLPRVGWLFLVLAALLGIQNLTRVVIFEEREPIDFYVFHAAGDAVSRGLSPYRGDPALGRRYHYPQAWAYMMVPLASIERERAAVLWKTLNAAVVVALLAGVLAWGVLWARRLYPSHRPLPRGVLALMFIAGAGYAPLLFGYRLGQLDILLAAMLAVPFVVPTRHIPLAAGLAIGLATVVKLSPLLLVPALTLALGWRFLSAVAGVVLVYTLLLVSSGLLGEEVYFFTEQMPFHQYRITYPASSLHALFGVYLFPDYFVRDGYYGGWMTSLVTAIVLAAYAICGLWVWWQRGSWLCLLAVGVCFSHLASHFLEPHHHTTLLVVAAPLLLLMYAGGDRRGIVLVAAAWFVGGVYLNVSEGFAGWPPFVLMVGDLLLLAAVLRNPRLGGESPWLLSRDLFPTPGGN